LGIGLLVGGWTYAGGEIHGTIETTRGERLTGPIRWDTNENFWDDRLDARKTDRVETRDPEDGFRLSLFGWELISSESSGHSYSQFSIPFGHLRAIEPEGTNSAVVELKDGSRIRVDATGSDLGRELDLVISDPDQGDVEVAWRRIARIEFSQGEGEGKDGERLYGTPKTREDAFTGYIVWDRTESLTGDILDGEEDGEDREIAFAEIASIEPAGPSGARVGLKSGSELELRGTNDVDRRNRGILVTVAGLGTIEVQWEELQGVEFHDPPPSATYDRFDGGRRLAGKVHAKDGTVYEGSIIWDMDEAFSWESLDGEKDNLEYSVTFGNVRSIRPLSRGAEVRLADDRTLTLFGSNDVSSDNRGVMIASADGAETILSWDDIELVEFD
jgi:hypothetical protein